MKEYYIKLNNKVIKVKVNGSTVKDLIEEADKSFSMYMKDYYEWEFCMYINSQYIHPETDLIYVYENEYNEAYEIKL